MQVGLGNQLLSFVGQDSRLSSASLGDATSTNMTSYLLVAADTGTQFYRRNIVGISTQPGPFRMKISPLNSCSLRMDNTYASGGTLNLAGELPCLQSRY